MNSKEIPTQWTVEVAPEAITQAHEAIVQHYQGVDRKNMEAWLGRFLVEVYNQPLNVLGFPPKVAASDRDMLYFPGDPHFKVSGMAHASRQRRIIHVYEIMIQPPAGKPGQGSRGRRNQ